jgi:hypothetical protein
MTSSSGDGARHAVGGREHDVRVLLDVTRHLEGREVLAVLADPVVGAVEEEEARTVAHEDVAEIAREWYTPLRNFASFAEGLSK